MENMITVKTEPLDIKNQYIYGNQILNNLTDVIEAVDKVCEIERRKETENKISFHLRSKNYKCEHCNYATSTKGILKTHIQRIHLKQKDHNCNFCNYQSYAKETLKNHINRVHLKLKGYQCHLCDHATHNKYLLKTHIDLVHHIERKYECNF